MWLNENLKQEVRNVFEPRYKRKLSDDEVVIIANNLTNFMEIFIKFKLKQNENQQITS